MRRYHLWLYIFVAMTLCLMLPLGLLGWFNYKSAREMARAEITESALPLTRDNIYSEIHSDLMEPIHVATTMANDSFLKSWVREGERNVERIQDYLFQIHRKYHFFSVFFVSAKTQKYYHFRGLQKVVSPDDSHDIWYYRFLKANREYVLDVDTDQVGNNELTIFLNFRVEGDNKDLLGVTGVGMKMDTVSRLLKSTGAKYGRHVFLVNRDGEVQAHAEPALIHHANIRQMPGIHLIAGEILGSLERMTNLEYGEEGERTFVTSRYMPELDWFLVVSQDEHAALAGARQNFIRTLECGALIWLFLIVILIILAQRYHVRMENLAHRDELTQLGNRRRFEEDFAVALARHKRSGAQMALILMDLDGFKAVNDQLGHVKGDELLRNVAESIRRVVRAEDRAARWGGDEFVVLANCPPPEGLVLAERIREEVRLEAQRLGERDELPARRKVAVSCGVVSLTDRSTLESVLHEADQLLYACKDAGGNCVKGR